MTESRRIATFFDRKATAWDAIYSGDKSVLKRWWNRLTRRNLQARFEFTIRAGEPWTEKRVLDVGCGSGRYEIALAQCGVREVVGLDVSSEMITLAEQLARDAGAAERCRFIQGDVLGFGDAEGFDVVIANGFFDYVLDPAPVIAKLRGLTRGPVIASFPARLAFRSPFRWTWLALHGCPLRFYSRAEVRRLFEQAGMTCQELRRSGPIYVASATVSRGGSE